MKSALLLTLAALLFGTALAGPLSAGAAENPTYQALPEPGAKAPLDGFTFVKNAVALFRGAHLFDL
jgi:hypothetical protein